MVKVNLEIYVDYFRSLAVSNTSIAHNPASEMLDDLQSEKRFCKWNGQEVIEGLRTQIKTPALMIELPVTEIDAATEADIRNRPKGSFAVIKETKSGDINGEEQAYIETERIVYELLQQIRKDHYAPGRNQCKTPFKDFLFATVTIEETGRILTSHFGWNVEFEFEYHKNALNNISIDPPEGAFESFLVLGDDGGWLGSNGIFLGQQL